MLTEYGSVGKPAFLFEAPMDRETGAPASATQAEPPPRSPQDLLDEARELNLRVQKNS